MRPTSAFFIYEVSIFILKEKHLQWRNRKRVGNCYSTDRKRFDIPVVSVESLISKEEYLDAINIVHFSFRIFGFMLALLCSTNNVFIGYLL